MPIYQYLYQSTYLPIYLFIYFHGVYTLCIAKYLFTYLSISMSIFLIDMVQNTNLSLNLKKQDLSSLICCKCGYVVSLSVLNTRFYQFREGVIKKKFRTDPQFATQIFFFVEKRNICRMFCYGKICILMKKFEKYIHLVLFYVVDSSVWIF